MCQKDRRFIVVKFLSQSPTYCCGMEIVWDFTLGCEICRIGFYYQTYHMILGILVQSLIMEYRNNCFIKCMISKFIPLPNVPLHEKSRQHGIGSQRNMHLNEKICVELSITATVTVFGVSIQVTLVLKLRVNLFLIRYVQTLIGS